VIPLMHEGNVIGVMDLDSPKLKRFDEEDARGLEAVAQAFLESTDLGG
jgi:GAF domain-containing protein